MGSQISSPEPLSPCGDLPTKTESADQQRGTFPKDFQELLNPEPGLEPTAPPQQTYWDDPTGILLPPDMTIRDPGVQFRVALGLDPEPLRLSDDNNNVNRAVDRTLKNMREL